MLVDYYNENDFYKQLNDYFRLTTVEIIYRLPDYYSILQEFLWQTIDVPPQYPRIYKFIDYWERNIEGKIYSVKIANVEVISPANFQSVAKYYTLNQK